MSYPKEPPWTINPQPGDPELVVCDAWVARLYSLLLKPKTRTEVSMPDKTTIDHNYFQDTAIPTYPSFSDFCAEVATMLGETAKDKGYSKSGPDGRNPLFEVTGANHAMGEIIYKAVRFRDRVPPDPKDLLKIAAWAFLAWKFNGRPPL